jgi:hypothetical protein
MTIILNNSFTDKRVRELFDLFMDGKINRNDIEQENFKVYDRFFYYAREQIWEKNINFMLPVSVNNNHRSILKFLNFKVCCNKRCSSWIEKLPHGVAGCGACKIRKAENRLVCRLSKKIKQEVCDSDNKDSESESKSKSESKSEEKDCVCPICIDNMEIASVLPCGHRFHQKCINHWLINNKENCPCCRLDLNLNLNVKYNNKNNKRKTLNQRIENMHRLQSESEKKRRSYIRRQNIRARAQMVIRDNRVSYSNDRGFSYERFGAVFPYYTVVRIVKRRIYDLRSYKKHCIYVRETHWSSVFSERIRRSDLFDEFLDNLLISDIRTPEEPVVQQSVGRLVE